MQKILLTLTILSWLTFISCLPDSPDTQIEVTFCELLVAQNEAAVGEIIDIYFDSLEYTAIDSTPAGQAENIQNFAAWLDAHDCIDSVRIDCISCVETLPLQSEITIKVKDNIVSFEKTMDILMSTPLRFNGFH